MDLDHPMQRLKRARESFHAQANQGSNFNGMGHDEHDGTISSIEDNVADDDEC
jgi:hypothetical protein